MFIFMKDWQNPYGAVLQNWAAALNRGDIPAVLSLYAEHAMLVPTMVGAFLENQQARATYFKSLLDRGIQVQFSDGLPHKLTCGNIVILSGDYEFFSANEGSHVHARFSFSLLNDGDGIWKIIHHHSSQTPEKILLVNDLLLSAA